MALNSRRDELVSLSSTVRLLQRFVQLFIFLSNKRIMWNLQGKTLVLSGNVEWAVKEALTPNCAHYTATPANCVSLFAIFQIIAPSLQSFCKHAWKRKAASSRRREGVLLSCDLRAFLLLHEAHRPVVLSSALPVLFNLPSTICPILLLIIIICSELSWSSHPSITTQWSSKSHHYIILSSIQLSVWTYFSWIIRSYGSDSPGRGKWSKCGIFLELCCD